eukprot:s441_g13.t1
MVLAKQFLRMLRKAQTVSFMENYEKLALNRIYDTVLDRIDPKLHLHGNCFATKKLYNPKYGGDGGVWSKKGPLSLKPLSSWFPDIIARVAFFQNWNDLGKTPPVHWISGIFFPQAFFTGAMQNYARKHGEEIDLLSFSQKVMDNVTNPKKETQGLKRFRKDFVDVILIFAETLLFCLCNKTAVNYSMRELMPKSATGFVGNASTDSQDGVYIYGLFIEGARWDSVTHMDRKPNPTDYRCPTYKVLSRKGTLLTTGHSTNFVLYLELPTDQAVSKWIKAGVASFLALKH